MTAPFHNTAPAIPGVYMLVNTTNNRVYVGSSQNIRRRVAQQISALRRQRHPNRYLQCAWDASGEAAFFVRVIEEVGAIPRKAREQREQVWLNHYRAWEPGRGYNQTPYATGTLYQRSWRRYDDPSV